MRWRGRRQSRNVDDLRGGGYRSPRAGRGGGGLRIPVGRRGGGIGGLGALILVLVAVFVFDVDPLTLLQGGDIVIGRQEGEARAGRGGDGAPTDEAGRFAATILADTETAWGEIFVAAGERYEEPRLALFNGSVSSACGFASAASGPFYCPGDRRLYLDLGFFDELRSRFDAPGDFAQAYVIAHEVGHHVQTLLGVMDEFQSMRGRLGEAEYNALSVRVELQADCLAGVWGHFAAAERDYLERGDIEEALNAAAQIGDDAIQRRTQGHVVPESFNHGTSVQRARWFRTGLEAGRVDACNTFDAARP